MLYKMRRWGYGFRAIVRELGRSQSTIIREISRNGLRGHLEEDYYTQAQRAHEEAHNRRVASSKRKGRLKCAVWRHYTELHLRAAHPETIAGKLTIYGYPISAEAIYQYIYTERPELKSCLLIAGQSRRRSIRV